jgi:hypothetical protein
METAKPHKTGWYRHYFALLMIIAELILFISLVVPLSIVALSLLLRNKISTPSPHYEH